MFIRAIRGWGGLQHRYRLIIKIHYNNGVVFIRFVGTHAGMIRSLHRGLGIPAEVLLQEMPA